MFQSVSSLFSRVKDKFLSLLPTVTEKQRGRKEREKKRARRGGRMFEEAELPVILDNVDPPYVALSIMPHMSS
jgi:hypothetical protein